MRLARRKVLEEEIEQLVGSFPIRCGDGNDVVEEAEVVVLLHQRQQLVFLDEINLVEDGEALRFDFAQHVDDVLISVAERLAGVDHHGHDVRFG